MTKLSRTPSGLAVVFNNLVVFDQHKPQVSLETTVSDLPTSRRMEDVWLDK
ncbi:hypothetical protein [Bradyrhizobium sp. Tv2a-2]|uniref:hypothetical protein n=1 Tax=Bradyrhizobium sp. Tv2a-2 TaxID=113395 RepID=UPI0012EB851E|nr:hypothetical protein [Bradyrhizobium sp. Tv2a-2]